jgi:hypothetical protein
MEDGIANKWPELALLRQRARDYLDQAQGLAPLDKMRAELAEKDSQISDLRRTHKELVSEVADLKKQLRKQAS